MHLAKAMVRGRKCNPTAATPGTLSTPHPTRLEAFFTPREAPTSPMRPSNMAASPATATFSLPELGAASQRIERILAEMPTRADIREIVAEVRDSLQQDINPLRAEVESVENRVVALEQTAARATDQAVEECPMSTAASGIWRRLDDLDKRSRRHNLRIRGVPETETATRPYLVGLFNYLLDSREVTSGDLARAHRALRPPPSTSSAPPRDIICCLVSFVLKDRLYAAARSQQTWNYGGAKIAIFNDLSPTTLQARRLLHPLTQALQTEKIPYRWGFPLSLSVRHNNSQLVLRTPEDVPHFLNSLGLPCMAITNWEIFDFKPPQVTEAVAQRRRPSHLPRPMDSQDATGE
uniref:Uncharacterized protein n=1 Tax=Leptobrachium leishanense TaxID=445787 RepID=A0A8C5LK86_9ANUR